MKIIIPIVGSADATKRIADSFHNTEFACIYDSSERSFKWIATKSLISEGNLDSVLRQNKISVVITRNMPLMALGFFTESGFAVYKAESEDIVRNIELFHQNQLVRLTNSTAKSGSACSGSCGSCNTTCKS